MTFSIPDFLESGAIMSLSQDQLLIGWGPAQRMARQEITADKPAFYFSDFFFKCSLPWLQYSHWTEMSRDDLQEKLREVSSSRSLKWTIPDGEQFKQSFDELWHLLQKGDLQKAVPYLFARSSQQMGTNQLQKCLKRGLTSLGQSVGYLYGYWDATKGVLGVTPELLFRHSQWQPQTLHTMAVAGTCHSSHSHEALMKSEKERNEHQLVVQGICQSLQSLGSIQVGELQLLQLPKLTHLMTPIEAQLAHVFDFEKIVHCLHPTPALGAFPREEGKKWLSNFQMHTPRDYYGAPIGFSYPQKGVSQCCVGIRNVQWDDSGMRIGAGCGVLKQSTFEKEWQEIQLKIQAIRDQLNL